VLVVADSPNYYLSLFRVLVRGCVTIRLTHISSELNDDDSRGDLQETCGPVGGNIRGSLRTSETDANLRNDWWIGTRLQHNRIRCSSSWDRIGSVRGIRCGGHWNLSGHNAHRPNELLWVGLPACHDERSYFGSLDAEKNDPRLGTILSADCAVLCTSVDITLRPLDIPRKHSLGTLHLAPHHHVDTTCLAAEQEIHRVDLRSIRKEEIDSGLCSLSHWDNSSAPHWNASLRKHGGASDGHDSNNAERNMDRSILHLPDRETGDHPACSNSSHRRSSQNRPKHETVPDPKPNDDTMSKHGADSIDQVGRASSFDPETNANKA